MKLKTWALAALMALACVAAPLAALAQPGPTNNTRGISAYDNAADAIRTECVDPTTHAPVTCGGAGGGGSLSAKANAAAQTSTEGATTDPLSMDLTRHLRVIDDAVTALLTTLNTTVSSTAAQGVKGSIASGTAATDAPVYGGCRASTTAITAVADGQMIGERCTKTGAVVVHQFTAPEQTFRFTPVTISSTTETTIIPAGGPGVSNAIVQMHACNNSVTQVRVDFRDVAAGTVQDTWTLPAGQCIGYVLNSPLKQTTANSAWTAQLSASVTDVRISGQYVQ